MSILGYIVVYVVLTIVVAAGWAKAMSINPRDDV